MPSAFLVLNFIDYLIKGPFFFFPEEGCSALLKLGLVRAFMWATAVTGGHFWVVLEQRMC